MTKLKKLNVVTPQKTVVLTERLLLVKSLPLYVIIPVPEIELWHGVAWVALKAASLLPKFLFSYYSHAIKYK